MLVEIPSDLWVNHRQFEKIAASNRDLRLELTSDGVLIAMPPAGSDTGNKNVELAAEFVIWNRKRTLGVVFDSSAGFTLSNGAVRSPDGSWIQKERWEAIPKE